MKRKLILLFLASSLFSCLCAREVIGLLKGREEVLLKSKSQGQLTKIFIKEGEKVRVGDLIATLDDKKEKVEVELALAEFKASEQDYKSSSKLKKFLSSEELTKKKNDYLRKKSNYELKKIALEAKQFIAPIDGILARRYINLGESISSGEKSFEVINMQELVIDLDIEAKNAQKLTVGDKLSFNSELHPDKKFSAAIYHIGPVLDKASGTVKVKLQLSNTLIENKQYLFKPGTMIHINLK